jgi:DNA polymerase III epsilon subunit-like protein
MTFPSTPTEFYISVDVETSGPNPGLYSMLSIGACTLDESRQVFYVEMKPDKPGFEPEAVRISQLSLERLAAEGMEPALAMQRFADWITQCTPAGSSPLFLGFNAPFDWMFVCDYFQRYLGQNPFGHTAIDIKSFYMGLNGISWSETSMSSIAPRFLDQCRLTHNALQDAIDQAAIFKQMLAESKHTASK